jgi:hypothetical protein
MPKEPKEPIVLTADDLVAAPPALIRAGIETLPALIAAAGGHTSERFIEFLAANIRNRNTRMAYALAVRQFFDWCEQRGLRLDAIKPTAVVAAYIEQIGARMAKPSVKQHLAASRQLFDYLVTGGILPSNPAGVVLSNGKNLDGLSPTETCSFQPFDACGSSRRSRVR